MQYLTLIALLPLIAASWTPFNPIRRQDAADVPACATSCFTSADPGSCGATDYSCLCTSQTFLGSVQTCLQNSCSAQDVAAATQYGLTLCSVFTGATPSAGGDSSASVAETDSSTASATDDAASSISSAESSASDAVESVSSDLSSQLASATGALASATSNAAAQLSSVKASASAAVSSAGGAAASHIASVTSAAGASAKSAASAASSVLASASASASATGGAGRGVQAGMGGVLGVVMVVGGVAAML